MNVAIVIPTALRPLVEGRQQIELGVPITADLGDLVQTLLTLYPRLRTLQPDERQPLRRQLQLFADERTQRDLLQRRFALREGERFFLSGLMVREGTTRPG